MEEWYTVLIVHKVRGAHVLSKKMLLQIENPAISFLHLCSVAEFFTGGTHG